MEIMNLFKSNKAFLFLVLTFLNAVSCVNERTSNLIPIPVVKDSLFGFIDDTGGVVIPFSYAYAGFFSYNGLAPVRMSGDTLMGYIKEDGTWAIEPSFIFAHPFFNGMAQVTLIDGREAFIFSDGSVSYVIDTAFSEISFRYRGSGVTCVKRESDSSYLLLDKYGNSKMQFKSDFCYFISDSVLLAHNYYASGSNFLLSVEGDTLYSTPNILDIVYNDGCYLIRGKNDCLLDKNFDTLYYFSSDEYDVLGPLSEGVLPFHDVLRDKMGYIDVEGNVSIPPIYDFCYGFYGGLAAVKEGELIGFIDRENNLVIPFEYSYLYKGFKDNFAIVKKDSIIVFIDKNGKAFWQMSVPPLYFQVRYLSSDWGDDFMGE